MLPSYSPTPLQEIHDQLFIEAGVRVLIKREDLNHEHISGNKWWKLKYNLEEATRQEKKILLTFGGAYSNHLYATAAAASESGFKSIGIVRGEETLPLNSTLSFVKNCGMQLHFISRKEYRNKNDPAFIQKLHDRFGDFYLIPEGGTNALAVKGTREFGEVLSEIEFHYICLPVGTGGTMAGIIAGLDNTKSVIGFPVLKGGDFLNTAIGELLKDYSLQNDHTWSLDTSYHLGGYAKVNDALRTFIQKMKVQHNLPLDHVYTGKLLWAVYDYVNKGKFKRGSIILVLHTGGLQGIVNKLA